MSYDDLLPWRALAQRIPKDVLNPTHRLIIVTLMTYESEDKGAFFSPENIASELGLSYRAVLDNFHYLGSGLVWKDHKLTPCLNPDCKDHLKIIKTSYYAKRKRAQTYRLDQQAIRDLASVHSGAPINESVQVATDKRAPEHPIACAPVHAHRHNKHLINVHSYDRFNELILKHVPKELRATITAGKNLDTLLDELSELGVTDQAIGSAINLITWSNVIKAGAIVSLTLTGLVEETKKALAREKYEADKRRELDLERLEAEKNKASGEAVDRYLQSVREQLGRA